MGKASRSKGNKSKFERAEKEREQTLSRFLTRAGIVLPSSNAQMWSIVEAKLGAQYADQLGEAIDERAENSAAGRPNSSAVYDLVYRDLDAAMATVPFVVPMLRAWAHHFQSLDLPGGPMVDLGSGSGILPCLYATVRPDVEVTGIEIHPGGVACAQALAQRLGLPNVSFVQGDVLKNNWTDRFAVATSVASLTEMDGYGPEPSHTFSTIRSAETVWGSSDSVLAVAAAGLLRPGGVLLTMERLPDFMHIARWASALQRSGLSIDLAASAHVIWSSPPAGGEATPAFWAQKLDQPAPITLDGLIDWYCTRNTEGEPEFLVELELLTATRVALVAGKHFEIRDQHGAGQTRVYLLELDEGAVIYMSTSRGARMACSEAPTSAELVPEFRRLILAFNSSREVVGGRDLLCDDLAEELGRPVDAVQE